jgi:hypothetical protein
MSRRDAESSRRLAVVEPGDLAEEDQASLALGQRGQDATQQLPIRDVIEAEVVVT